MKAEEKREKRAEEGAKRDWEKKKPQVQEKAAEYERKISEVVLYPFTLKEISDQTTVPLPAGRAPVVYMAPLYGSSGKPSPATSKIESMLRYQLRPSVTGPVGLNLVPNRAINMPYSRKIDAPVIASFKPDQHLEDARKVGADLLVYGRADRTQDTVVLQLVCFDTKTSRTEQFSKSLPATQLPDVLAEAANTVIRMAGLDDAAAATHGLKPVADALPTSTILETAIQTDKKTLDTTAARKLMAETGGKCPWFWDYLASTVGGDGGIDLINEALRAAPKDPRLLLAKANILSGADPNTAPAAPLLALMALCRQPDSLMAASNVGAYLGDSKSPNLPVLETYQQFKTLAERYPAFWPLRWDLGRAGALVTLSRDYLAMAEYWQAHKGETKKPGKEEMARLEQQATRYNLADTAMADLRAASDSRPDCPGILIDLTYWHRILGEELGTLDPAKDLQWQSPLLARVNLLDSQNVEADLNVAWSLAGVDKARQMQILGDMIKRTKRDPAVMKRVADNILETLRIECDLYKSADENQQQAAVSKFAQSPEAAMFSDALLTALDNDVPGIWQGLQHMAWLLGHANPPVPDVWTRFYAWKNGHYRQAQDSNADEKWEEALKHAQRCVGLMPDGDDVHRMRYIIVRSLWKLGRLREALYQAELGIYENPRRHTFHYMFAVIAVDLNDRFEEAYERAVIASELDPKNEAVKALVKKLKAKIDRG